MSEAKIKMQGHGKKKARYTTVIKLLNNLGLSDHPDILKAIEVIKKELSIK